MLRLKRLLFILIGSLVPEVLKPNLYHFLFIFFKDPKFLVLRAEKHFQLGNAGSAERFFLQALEALDNPQSLMVCEDRHQLEFRAYKGLYHLGVGGYKDPLFDCELKELKESRRSLSEYKACVDSHGVRIFGLVINKKPYNAVEVPEYVGVYINNLLVRRERLEYLDKDHVKFSFRIKRNVIESLKKENEIHVKLDTGYVFKCNGFEKLTLIAPHGKGSIETLLNSQGLLTKKGDLKPSDEELILNQKAYLSIYERANVVFQEEFGRPLFLMYGTLLGLYRDGGFIPGDDDFDIGYVSEYCDPQSVKKEAIRIMKKLVGRGFIVVLNRRGKPFRIKHPEVDDELHLDVRPVWRQDGYVWAHKQACLKLDIDDFRKIETRLLDGRKVVIPLGTEQFLRAYYGKGWRFPDPGFSNSSKAVDRKVLLNLNQCCLTKHEQWKVKVETEKNLGCSDNSGCFQAVALENLYPLRKFRKISGL